MPGTQEAVSSVEMHKLTKHVSEEISQVPACGVSDHQSTINIRYPEDSMAGTSKSPETEWARIPKVPDILQKTRAFEKHFKPRRISMGPYHHGKPEFRQTEELKARLTKKFILEEHGDLYQNKGEDLYQNKREALYKKILEKISQIKSCYDIEGSYDDEKLAKMMLVDGCFLLCFIQYATIDMLKDLKIDYPSAAIIMQDLFLLENQLPFWVLKLLLGSRENKNENNRDGIEILISEITQIETPADNKNEEPSHLLDLLRTRLLGKPATTEPSHHSSFGCVRLLGKPATTEPSHHFPLGCVRPPGKSAIDGYWFINRNVKELMASGIRFRRSKTSKLSDVSFKSYGTFGYLHLPPLTIDSSTVPRLLNLIAYEMCPNMTLDSGVTSYISFLDSLIDYSEDVKELESARVLRNFFGSREEVAQFFNSISVNLPILDFGSYSDIVAKIGAHVQILNSNTAWNWTKELLDNHCTSPWKFIALLAAALVLFLTGVQTFFAAFPRSG